MIILLSPSTMTEAVRRLKDTFIVSAALSARRADERRCNPRVTAEVSLSTGAARNPIRTSATLVMDGDRTTTHSSHRGSKNRSRPQAKYEVLPSGQDVSVEQGNGEVDPDGQ
jgi:hypothetical protein